MSIVGNYASPDTPGSAYVLLHHVFGEVNGKMGAWGHSVGGMGAITTAMAAACVAAGVEISLESPVERVLVSGGKAVGVRLVSGEEIAAPIIAANVGPALLFARMVDASDLPADFNRRMATYRTGSGTFRMNVALSELPDFSVLPGTARAEHHTAGIIIAPSLDYMDRAFTDAKSSGWSTQPVIEMKLPTTVDDSLAPPGLHVASLFCQQFAPVLPDGQSLGRCARKRCRSHHRQRHRPCPQFRAFGDRPANPFAARSGAQVRPCRRRHLPRPHEPRPIMGRAPGARRRQLPRRRSPACTCADRAPTPAAALPARRGTTPPMPFWRTGAGRRAGAARVNAA